jgi:hypothetical protein
MFLHKSFPAPRGPSKFHGNRVSAADIEVGLSRRQDGTRQMTRNHALMSIGRPANAKPDPTDSQYRGRT